MDDEIIEDQDTNTVTFGSIIAINDFKHSDAFVFSDGFLKTNVFVKDFKSHDGNAKKKVFDGLEDSSFFKCLFQVVPRVSDTAKAATLEHLRDKIKIHPLPDEFDLRFRDKLDKGIQKSISDYISSLLNEYKQNIDTIDKARMQKLTYHYPFQLLHIASGQFLAIHEMEAQIENQNYCVKLDDYSSDLTVFKISPAFQYQSAGEQDVNAGELCAISRVKVISNREAFLSCSNQSIVQFKNGAGKYDGLKREVNASVEQPHQWKINLFQQYIPESSRNLRVGDCIWLYHSEAEATLTVEKKQPAVDKNNFTFYNLSDWLSYNNLQIDVSYSEQESTQGYQGSTNGMWQIEGSNRETGGFVMFEKNYRLRNLSTGYYLKVDKTKQLDLVPHKESTTLFQFVDLKTQPDQKYVKGGSYSYIQNIQSKNWIDFIKKQDRYNAQLKDENQKTEHAVFKIHMATRNEVWEMNFLLSCFRMLAKFLIQVQDPRFSGVEDFKSKKVYMRKFLKIINCITNLDDFVNNKVYTTSVDQLYGQTNSFRQKLLREQFYIDILVKILDRILTKGELEFHQERTKIQVKQQDIFKKPDSPGSKFNSPSQLKINDQFEEDEMIEDQLQKLDHFETEEYKIQNDQVLNYIKTKVQLANCIYSFLGSACKHNSVNSKYIYDLIPYFQLQSKYLPIAVDTIIKIVCSDKQLMYRLSEGLKIEQQENTQINTNQIKILINLYDGDDEDGQDLIPFNKHEKITQKPVNIIQYFINLIWDEDALNNSQYLKFLRHVCSFLEEPIKINQENIFKLYKRFNDNIQKLGVETKPEVQKFKDGTIKLNSKAGQLIIPKDVHFTSPETKHQFIFLIEQLLFFSEVAFGRNFLWKDELGAQFEKSFLFRNIWNKNPIEEKYKKLQPCFAKLGLSLYIDQEPLLPRRAPFMCVLFSECDQPKDYKVFKSLNGKGSNLQELNTYQDLVNNLKEYFVRKNNKIISQISIKDPKDPTSDQQDDQGIDLLSSKLLLNSTYILESILKLELLNVLKFSKEDEEQKIHEPQQYISEMVGVLVNIFQYDKFELNYVRAHTQTQLDRIKAAKEKKVNVNLSPLNLISDLKKMANITKKVEEEEIDRGDEFQMITEQNLYQNPVMKGFLKLQSALQQINYLDPIRFQNENQIKIKICDIFEYILEINQDFMLQNALVFFKNYIINVDHPEFNMDMMRQKFREDRKKRRANRSIMEEVLTEQEMRDFENQTFHFDELRPEQLVKLICKRVLSIHQLGLLPNLAKTGIKDIDHPHVNKNNLAGLMSGFVGIFNRENANIPKPKKGFYNYIQERKIEGIPQQINLDQYYSIFWEDPTPFDESIGAILPSLLNTFSLIKDQQLEKRCLKLILRLFTQKDEFRTNLMNLQVIFDQEKTVLYRYLQINVDLFIHTIDRMETWMDRFLNSDRGDQKELNQCIQILQNMNNGLKKGIKLIDGEINYEIDDIDPEKQQLFGNLKAHLPVIRFINEGMPFLHDSILDENIEEEKKSILIDVFAQSFEFLRNFCADNSTNQLLLYENFQIINYLQYDLGQIKLIKEIFKNNKVLLTQKTDTNLIQIFVNLVEREGRQKQFLQVLETFIQYDDRYIFDNQLIVLNALLPHERGDRFMKIMYADGSPHMILRFYFDDPINDPESDFKTKLQQMRYRDTFRDEPFYYHNQLLDILIQITLVNANDRPYDPLKSEERVKDNFNISVSKLKTVITADYLLNILKQKDSLLLGEYQKVENIEMKAQGLSLIKLQVLEFLRLIHISAERGQIQHSQLYSCQDLISDFFDFELKRIDRYNQSTWTQQLADFYYLGVVPFALAYYERFLRRDQANKLEQRKDLRSIESFILQLMRKSFKVYDDSTEQFTLTDYLANLFNQALNSYCKSLNEVKNKIRGDITQEDVCIQLWIKVENLLKSKQQEQTEQAESPENIFQKQKKHKNKDKKKKKKKIKRKKQIIQKIIFDDKAKEGLLEGFTDAMSHDTQLYWNGFVDELVNSDSFYQESEKERDTIARAIINIKQLLDPKLAQQQQVVIRPDVMKISRKLIFYLQSAFNDPSCKGTIQTLLKVLQKIIEREEDQQKKKEMQNLYDKLGATQMVLVVLSENSKIADKKLLMSFFEFINTMLEGGNTTVQETIFNFMMSFPQSENIFQKIYILIKKQIENIEIKSKAKSKSKDDMLQIDEKEFQEDLLLVNQVLTFLQNAVEGHFKNLQNYFRHQKNSRNNYDLTNLITELFKTYYYEDKSKNSFDNMIQCLNTLNELVQGPCQENQIAVSESKFLDIASHLFGETEKVKTSEDSEDLEEWMLSRLKNKILNLIMSLLEGREIKASNQVLKRIMRNLPIQILERHCVSEYKRFKDFYHGKYDIEALQHLNVDPRKLSQKSKKEYSKEYFEVLLQNGFQLFFLISYYLEADPQIKSPVQSIQRKFKEQLLKVKKENLYEFLKDQFKFIFQTYSFIKALSDALSSAAVGAVSMAVQKTNQVGPEEDLDKQQLKLKKEEFEQAIEFYMNNSAHIDIMHDENLEVVYFIKLPLCQFLPQEQKDIFNDQVDRSTTQSKVQGLINESRGIIKVCQHDEFLQKFFQRYKILAAVTTHVELWRELSFFLTIFLNLFILFSFNSKEGQSQEERINQYIFFGQEETFTVSQTQTIIYIVGLVMTVLSLIVVSYFLMKNAPLIIQKAWMKKSLFGDEDPNPVFQLIDYFYKLFTIVIQFLQEIEVMYYIAYGLFAILGTFFHPFFFIFHLSEILFRYPTLQNIIKSIWRPKEQLILTFFLLFLLVYVFTIIAYILLSNQYGGYCDVLLYCFLINVAWTFRGSIGNYQQGVTGVYNTGVEFGVLRFLFDVISTIILANIMLNIVAGIIIDTFGSLREEEEGKIVDIRENCFICGKEKQEFDRIQSKKYDIYREHLKINHYMWNYMYFIAYLQWKDKMDQSGIESYVDQKLKEDDISWIPIGQARELKALDNNNFDKEKEIINKIQDKVKRVQDTIIEMTQRVTVKTK